MINEGIKQIEINGKTLNVRCNGNPQELITAIFTTTKLIGYKINSSYSLNDENKPIELNISITKLNNKNSEIDLNIKINHKISESSGLILRIRDNDKKYFPSYQINQVLQEILNNL